MSRADFLALLEASGDLHAAALVPFGYALADHPDPRERDPRRALAIGERIVQDAPGDPQGWEIVARAALQLGEHRRVLDIFERSRVDQRSISLLAERDLLHARSLHGVGRVEEARALFERTELAIEDLVQRREVEWRESDLLRHSREAREELGLPPR
jgi:hypothetical protein